MTCRESENIIFGRCGEGFVVLKTKYTYRYPCERVPSKAGENTCIQLRNIVATPMLTWDVVCRSLHTCSWPARDSSTTFKPEQWRKNKEVHQGVRRNL
jgi:hypothetical protein